MADPTVIPLSLTVTRIPRPKVLLSRTNLPPQNSLQSCPCNMSDPQTTTFSRQDSEPLSMNDFWQEVEHIKQTRYSDVEECSSSEPNTPEEGEAEEDWLQDTGLSPLIGDQTPVEDNVLLLSTLTRTQTAAVQRRLDSYSCSLRKRFKQPTRDVREVFDVTRIQDCLPEENGVSDKRAPPLVNGNTLKPSPNHLKVSEASNILYTDVAYSEQAAFGPKAESKTSLQPESLPNINIYKGRLGVTRVLDLSPLDVKPVPSLALIELTALFDVLDIELKRNKAVKRKAAEGRLFGVMLNALLEQDQKVVPHTRIPLILEATLLSATSGVLGILAPTSPKHAEFLLQILTCLEKKGLTVQGILRVPGAQARIKTLQQRLERDFYGGLICWDDVNPHDASGLLKLFLRELPAPLLTAEYLPAFSAVQNISDMRQKLQALNLLVLVLPEPNRHTLKALLEFLHKVASHEKSNLMSMWNIATIIAPNLFLYRGSNLKSVEGGGKQQAEGVAGVVMAMVQYQDLLWTVPTFLLSQVRKLNESRSKRSAFGDQKIRNFLRKIHKDKEKQEKNQTEPCKQVKVRTPLFVRDTLVIQLNEETRASDVLQQFQKQMTQRNWQMNSVASMKCNGPVEFPKLDLYEVGGNICERCLDPDTYLLDLQTVNPNGEWVIKARHPSPPVL